MIDCKKLHGKFVKEKHNDQWLIYFEEFNNTFDVNVIEDCFVVSTQQPFQLGGLPVEVCSTPSEDNADFILMGLNELIKDEQ